MAAAVAHQHAGLWHRRPDHFHIPDVHYTGMMPSYDHQRAGINNPLQNYQAVTTQMDISLPLFSANVLATSVPYQSSGTFAYDSSANPYNMQQSNMQTSYPMSYPAYLQRFRSKKGQTTSQIPLHERHGIHSLLPAITWSNQKARLPSRQAPCTTVLHMLQSASDHLLSQWTRQTSTSLRTSIP
jgi:hypothetical protein